VMPLLARAKRRVALGLASGALLAETQQTMICTYLSAILLGGLGLNAAAGWWWADPLAALGMVPLIAYEGIEALRGRDACGCREMAAPGRPGAGCDVDCGNGAHTG
jgi:divalent metal cation (Fe/Co/Zn/Cd) transporter